MTNLELDPLQYSSVTRPRLAVLSFIKIAISMELLTSATLFSTGYRAISTASESQ